jgi:hypothetical protein
MTAQERRDLTANERSLLRLLLRDAGFPGGQELAAQVEDVAIVGGPPTLLHLEVPPTVSPAGAEDGVIPVRAFVHGDDGEIEGEVMVWVKNGYLSGLEFAWYSDSTPTGMPEASRVRVT